MAVNTSGGVGLADIAKDANCSVAAVSFVLNPGRSKAARISEQTRRRILASAKKLGYRPNRNAEFLKRGYIPEIGLFLPNFGTNLILELIKGCCTSAQEAAFSVSLNFDESEQALEKFLTEATARRNCGLLLYPEHRFQGAEKQLEEYCFSGGKIVFLEPQGPEMLYPMPELPRVFLDDLKGGQLVAEHLLSQNCRNFIIYGDGRTRVTSFIQHIEKHACRFTHFSTATPVENIVEEIRSSNADTGVFCTVDILAVNLHTALLNAGIIPGQDIKLCGYDYLFNMERLTPKLTSVFQPFKELGYKAIKMLIDQIYGLPVENQTFLPELRPQESTLGYNKK